MAFIEERKRVDGKVNYRALIRLKGQPTQSATFKRKSDAKKWVAQVESAIREGRYFKSLEAKRHTLGDLIERYLQYELPNKPKSLAKQSMQLN